MNHLVRLIATLLVSLPLASCNMPQDFGAKFDDQHFKTAISLVELHKIRFGTYPARIEDLQFTGEWDAIALGSVDYRRSGAGYELNVISKSEEVTQKNYPAQFWQGIGLVKSNLKPGQ